MVKFQKDLTSSFQVSAPTRKRDAGRQRLAAGQNPGATKIPLPLRAGDKKYSNEAERGNKKLKSEPSGFQSMSQNNLSR